MCVGKNLQFFRAGVTVRQPEAGRRTDDFILTGDDKLHRAVITSQTGFGIKTVNQQKIGRQKPDATLRHRRKIMIRHKQRHARDDRRMIFRQLTRHTRADGFAHDIFWQSGGQQLKRFLGGGHKTFFAGRTGARTVARILQNKNLHVRRIVNRLRKVIASNGATGVAVDNQHTARRWAARRNFPADDLAGIIFPRDEAVFRTGLNHGVRRNPRRKEKQLPLQRAAAGAQEKVGDSDGDQNAAA